MENHNVGTFPFRAEALPADMEQAARGISALSLDLFDTLLFRAYGPPGSGYLALGTRVSEEGLIPCTPEVFARLRQSVERDCWQREDRERTFTLETIYAALGRELGLTEEQIPPLIDQELALERIALHPLRSSHAWIRLAHLRGVQLVYTSDTYLPESFIRAVLAGHGLLPQGARCFLSSHYGATKHSGRLFDMVLMELGLPAQAVLHVGDNPYSDVRVARRKGLRTLHFRGGRFNRYESLLAAHHWDSNGLTSVLAATSRRIRCNHSPDVQPGAIDAVTGVAAPLLTAYLVWILRRSEALGLERVYFLARDGEILARMAQALYPRLDTPLEARYLLVSRRSTNLAAVEQTGEAELAWIFRDAIGRPLGDILELLNLPDTETRTVAETLADPNITARSRIDERTLATVRQLAKDPAWSERILEQATRRQAALLAYLREQGVLDGHRIAFVDLGGVGSQLRALDTLCKQHSRSRPRFFVAGLEASSDPDHEWLERVECFLYDRQRGATPPPPRGLNTALQLFCTATHGSVSGYTPTENGVQVHLDPPSPIAHQWDVAGFQNRLLEFVATLPAQGPHFDPRGSARKAVLGAVTLLMRTPTRCEAKYWGQLPFEDGRAGNAATQPLARRYTLAEVALRSIDGSILKWRFPSLAWTHWPEGSLQLSSVAVRWWMRGLERLRRSLAMMR
ncbi:HAD family hydrolase [Halorhodospira halophila]|uniref:HAD family hydrolase n=1 Tax=Halorhodospira halophila TaxID=1053 RepID=UPI001913F4A7|nr:HAD hydrolase-like protein [Halorhodospira halophila]MBK5936499.1 hypothetical protein [Halorhodospira halophila]